MAPRGSVGGNGVSAILCWNPLKLLGMGLVGWDVEAQAFPSEHQWALGGIRLVSQGQWQWRVHLPEGQR